MTLVLAGFLLALLSGVLHPLALTRDTDGYVVCHQHHQGHVDQAPAPLDHDHTCVFCHLVHTLQQTNAPPPAVAWVPGLTARGSLALRSEARPERDVALGFSARAPPRI